MGLLKYEFPKNSPQFIKEFLRERLSVLHSILLNNLIGIYLYGSLAMGCFNPESSDVDVIIVVKKQLSKDESRRIIEYVKRACSTEKRLELSIVRKDVIRNPSYPIIVDLHYEYWGNISENEKDNEILSNLYTTRMRGFRVWGAPINDVFSRIPAKYHLRSVIEDLQCTKKYLHEKPKNVGYNVVVYWILGSCRILAFIREGKVLSKAEGGLWGLANLPKEYHELIEQAFQCYQSREKKNVTWNQKKLDAFADYMCAVILRESCQR